AVARVRRGSIRPPSAARGGLGMAPDYREVGPVSRTAPDPQQFRNSPVFEGPRPIERLDLAGLTALRPGAVVPASLSRGHPPTSWGRIRTLPASPPQPSTRGRSAGSGSRSGPASAGPRQRSGPRRPAADPPPAPLP